MKSRSSFHAASSLLLLLAISGLALTYSSSFDAQFALLPQWNSCGPVSQTVEFIIKNQPRALPNFLEKIAILPSYADEHSIEDYWSAATSALSDVLSLHFDEFDSKLQSIWRWSLDLQFYCPGVVSDHNSLRGFLDYPLEEGTFAGMRLLRWNSSFPGLPGVTMTGLDKCLPIESFHPAHVFSSSGSECVELIVAIDVDHGRKEAFGPLLASLFTKLDGISFALVHFIADPARQMLRVPMTGYGVQFRVKSQEYDASNDRDSNALFDPSRLHYINRSCSSEIDDKLVHVSGLDDDSVQDSMVDGVLDTSSFSKLGYQMTSTILTQDDPLNALSYLSSNLPSYAKALSEVELDGVFLEKADREQHSQQYSNAVAQSYRDDFEEKFIINSVAFDLNAVDSLQIFQQIEEEHSLYSQAALHCSNATAWLRGHIPVGPPNANPSPSPFSVPSNAPSRFDYRSPPVSWANDLEKQKMYKSWPSSLSTLLQSSPMYTGGIPPKLRRNAFSAVFALDPTSLFGTSIVNFVQAAVKVRKLPIRQGFWFYDSEVPSSSAELENSIEIGVQGEQQVLGDTMHRSFSARQRIRAFFFRSFKEGGIDALNHLCESLKRILLSSIAEELTAGIFSDQEHNAETFGKLAAAEKKFYAAIGNAEEVMNRLLRGFANESKLQDVLSSMTSMYVKDVSMRMQGALTDLQQQGYGPSNETPLILNLNGLLYILPPPMHRFSMYFPRFLAYEWQHLQERLRNGEIRDKERDSSAHSIDVEILERSHILFASHVKWLFVDPQWHYVSPPDFQRFAGVFSEEDLTDSVPVVLIYNDSAPEVRRTVESAIAMFSTYHLSLTSVPFSASSAVLSALGLSRTYASKNLVWLNGRVLVLDDIPAYSARGLETFFMYEWRHRLDPLARVVDQPVAGLNFAFCSSLFSSSAFSPVGYGRRQHHSFDSQDRFSFTTGSADSWLRIRVNVNPLSEHAPKAALMASFVRDAFKGDALVSFHLRARIQSLNRKDLFYYRMSLRNPASPICISHAVPLGVYSTFFDPPHAFLVRSLDANSDLDNVAPQRTPHLQAIFEVHKLVVESHIFRKGDDHGRGFVGLLPYATQSSLSMEDMVTYVVETSVASSVETSANSRGFYTMSNGGYLQFHVRPFPTILVSPNLEYHSFTPMFSSRDDTFSFVPKTNQIHMFVRSLLPRGFIVDAEETTRPSEQPASKIAEATEASHGFSLSSFFSKLLPKHDTLLKVDPCSPIRIFSVSSGAMYERLLRIMMLSVLRNTCSHVEFYFLESFLSPHFRSSIPFLASKYNFSYSFVNYQWPSARTFLPRPAEKQRVLWAYKILFTDVLFPPVAFPNGSSKVVHKLDRIMILDNDQIARTDMSDLYYMKLRDRHPYAYTPFCDSRTEQEGYRFWKQEGGYWRGHLGGRPYHISALSLVDLTAFRNLRAGDQLRSIFSELSRDPNSLSNLDQDLPNYAQHSVPIHSLQQDWLWCESWCDDRSKATAKTIDLCNNPKTKENKITNAKRVLEEWPGLDAELEAALQEWSSSAA
eukprot:ANDGO_03452.mRNA.1 UDP-glucose:glycoprotein glucosyltransferase